MSAGKQDDSSYIAIDTNGTVVDYCPMDSNPIPWMRRYPHHRLLITDTATAAGLVGLPLTPDNNDLIKL